MAKQSLQTIVNMMNRFGGGKISLSQLQAIKAKKIKYKMPKMPKFKTSKMPKVKLPKLK